MSIQRRRKTRRATAVGTRSPGTLMVQPASNAKHSAVLDVAGLMKQGKGKRHTGQGTRTVADLMHQ